MRLAAIAFAVILLLPFAAQAGDTINFGNASCGAPVPCDPSGSEMQAVANNAQSCSDMHFSKTGYTFLTDPLDGGNCLQATRSAAQPAGGMIMTPRCCVVPSTTGNGGCHIACQLNASRAQ